MTITAPQKASNLAFRLLKTTVQLACIGLIIMFVSCQQSNLSGAGSQKKIRVSVGEIKEISLPGRGDGTSELIGTSDNQEVVEVSRQQLAPAVDTLKRDKTAPAIFQLKGITAGTANVVFATKPLNQTGNGQPIRTYVVQVTAN